MAGIGDLCEFVFELFALLALANGGGTQDVYGGIDFVIFDTDLNG